MRRGLLCQVAKHRDTRAIRAISCGREPGCLAGLLRRDFPGEFQAQSGRGTRNGREIEVEKVVHRFQGCHENSLHESFQKSPHLMEEISLTFSSGTGVPVGVDILACNG